MNNASPIAPLPTYAECIEKAARAYAEWLAERQAAPVAAAA